MKRNGHVEVTLGGRTYKAGWRIVNAWVEIVSELGTEMAPMSPGFWLPAKVARGKLEEMAKLAQSRSDAGKTTPS